MPPLHDVLQDMIFQSYHLQSSVSSRNTETCHFFIKHTQLLNTGKLLRMKFDVHRNKASMTVNIMGSGWLNLPIWTQTLVSGDGWRASHGLLNRRAELPTTATVTKRSLFPLFLWSVVV